MSEAPLHEHTSKNTHNVVEQLLRSCDSAKRVLDIPAGEGAFSQRLTTDYDVTSADIQDSLKAKGCHFAQANMNERLPWDDESFDVVVCIDGIEHLERTFDFVEECHRILRPGGHLILSTPNITALRSRWRYLLTGFHNKGKVPLDESNPSPWHHINLLALPALRYMLHRSGFRMTAVTTNRVKAVSWLYLPLIPFSYALTAWVFNKEEKDPSQRARNRAVMRQMFTREALFGETLIVLAQRSS